MRSSWLPEWDTEEAAAAAVLEALFSTSISAILLALEEQKTAKRHLRQCFTAIDSTLVVEQEAVAGDGEEDTFAIFGTVAVEVKSLEEGTERIAIVVQTEKAEDIRGR